MSDAIEPSEKEGVWIQDGEVVLADREEFFRLTGAIAVSVLDGHLFVLTKASKSFQWVNIEDLAPPSAGTVLSLVKD